jgi:hypothetical protein
MCGEDVMSIRTTLRHPSTGKPHGLEVRCSEDSMEVISPPWIWKYVKGANRESIDTLVMGLQKVVNDEYEKSFSVAS